MAIKLFLLTSQLYMNPAYVSPRGTKVQGMFRVQPDPKTSSSFADLIDADIVYVLDVSSSMGGDGIDAEKKAAVASVTALKDGNRVGIYVFAGTKSGQWIVKPEVISDSSRQKMIKQIQRISANGMTCFYEPLEVAFTSLEQGSYVIKHIEFLTDGDSTEGGGYVGGRYVSDVEQTLDLVSRRTNGNVTMSNYGTGTNYNQKFMADITAAANGQFYHVMADGSGLDHLMGMNAARNAQAVAAKVTVEIRTLNGFKFMSSVDDVSGETKWQVYRTAPSKVMLTPMTDTLLVDPIGTVNAVEGIPYEVTLSGPALQAPAGETTWQVAVAKMTIRYTLSDGDHVEEIDMVQDFTTDSSLVKQDASVAQTMRQTVIEVDAADAAQQYSIAATMGDSAAMAQASMRLTMAQQGATRSGLSGLSVDLGEMVEGMNAGDVDSVLAKRTRMMNSADMDELLGGMES